MKSWLKFFGLSFFSDKIAIESVNRGTGNFLLGLLLTLVFVFCGVLSANAVPFSVHYNNASDFKALVRIACEELSVKDNKVTSDKVINTFSVPSDAEKYSVNGYNLVIDTRPAEALDNFTAYCVSKEGQKISYEDYLALPEEEQSGYTFTAEYTPEELVITEDLLAKYEEYLSSCSNEELKKQYSEALEKKGETPVNEYKSTVYKLYLKAYYPQLTEVPLLRNYYYKNYLNKLETKDSLFIFDTALVGYFKTDGGLEMNFFGTYDKLSEGLVSADGADNFIKLSFKATLSLRAKVYVINMIRLLPAFAIIPLVLALLVKLALKALKADAKYRRYSTCLTLEGSYLTVSAFITAIVTFICGFFTSYTVLNSLPLIALSVILFVRTAVFLIGFYLNGKKSRETVPAE